MHVKNPALKLRMPGKVLGEGNYLSRLQVNKQSLGEHHDFSGSPGEPGKQRLASLNIGQIQTNTFKPRGWFFTGKNSLFVCEDFRQIDFDPLKRGRQLHAI